MRVGEAKPHGSGATSTISLKHSTVLTTQQPLRFLGKRICRHPNGDITISLERSYYYNMLKQMDLDADNINPVSAPSLVDLQHNKIHHLIQIDITFTAKLLECSSGHHWYIQTSNSQQKITLDI